MQNEYADRQNMHLTILSLLDTPSYQSAWKNQNPTAFTTRAVEYGPMVHALTDLIAAQQTATTGYAEAKAREEQELENLCHEIGQTLADWYEENGREGDSAQIDLSLSTWQRLRDTELIAKARLLHQKLTAALASSGPALAEYDLTPADATLLATELADFELITADPSAAISRRHSFTVTLRPKFLEVSQHLKKWTASSSASAAPKPEPPSPTSGPPPASSATSAAPPPPPSPAPNPLHPGAAHPAPGRVTTLGKTRGEIRDKSFFHRQGAKEDKFSD